MKHLSLLLLIAFVSISAFSTIWHVNNIPGMAADFSNINSAFISAEVLAGDTLYVYGSPTSYGSYEISKCLTIIGPGYFLNQNTGLQSNPTPATMDQLVFVTGSEGTVVSGMSITYGQISANGIILQRNKLHQLFVYSANCIILQNYFAEAPYYNQSLYADGAVNLLIANNFIERSPGGWCVYLTDSCGGVLYNNITYGSTRLRNCEFYNNIVTYPGYGWELTFDYDANTSIHHNVFQSVNSWDWNNYGLTGEGNLLNVSDPIFVGTGSSDGYYQLCTGSPAIGAGVNGTNCGIFGGQSPYKLSGIPAIPTIYEFYAPATGFTIPVQISAKSNN